MTCRREFIVAVGGVLVGGPQFALAQPAPKMVRIGWLSLAAPAGNEDYLAGFRRGLQQLGYVEGRNLAIEYRFASGFTDRLETQAAELAKLGVSAIVVAGSQAAEAAKRATATIPIVMAGVGDPVGVGLVASLNRPGGNVTGLSFAHADTAAKWLELLHDVAPKATRFAYLEDVSATIAKIFVREIERAAQSLGVSLKVYAVTRPDEVVPQLDAMFRDGVQAFIVGPTPVPRVRQKEIVAFAAARRMPVMYAGRDYVVAGGLMSYNADRAEVGRQTAVDYLAPILKGANPATLAVREPTKIELVVNVQTARALGIVIPPAVQARVDEEIR